jgi:hypothetical protein
MLPAGSENSLFVCGTRSDWLSNSPQVKMALCAYRLQWVRGSTSTIVRVPAATRAAVVSFGNTPANILCCTLNPSTANSRPRSPQSSERKINGRAQRNLAHPVNHAFSSVRHRLVSFRQEFGQNREVLHRIPRTFRVGLKINNVGWRMPGKILLEGAPGARQDPAASIKTGDRSSENITRQRESCEDGTESLSVATISSRCN